MPPRITNRFSLPQPVVNAVSEFREWKHGEISITQLLAAPQRAYLERTYWHELEVDASDRLFILDGLADHYVLQHAADENTFAEERLSVSLDGWTITGQADLVEGSLAVLDEHKLTDYKRTSIWAALSDKPEWHGQVNGYVYLWESNGFIVTEAEIFARLRDWTKARANGGNYPPIAAMTIPVLLWGHEIQEEFLRDRLHVHQATWQDGYVPPPCTPEERWRRATTYALIRGGNRRATKVCDTLAEADAWRSGQDKPSEYRIEQRRGASVRCEDGYCDVARWCPQFQMMRQERDDADQGTY